MPRMHEFNQSLKYDKRMYAADVKGSIAFSKALLKAGIVDEKEQKELERGLKQVELEWKDGKVSAIVRMSGTDGLSGRRHHIEGSSWPCSHKESIAMLWLYSWALANPQFVVQPDDEDIHTANERRLSEIIGKDIGGKLHTGRSRNDQVATDMRIWLVCYRRPLGKLWLRSEELTVVDGANHRGGGLPQGLVERHGNTSGEGG
jgi:argininosuccinate lyase